MCSILLRDLFYFFRGCLAFSCLCAYLLLSLPSYLYRFLITKLVAPRFALNVGKALDPSAQAFSIDFLQPHINSRGTIVVTTVFEGTIAFSDLLEKVRKIWINAKLPNGKLLYPELQHYIESWMGFMFWKLDRTFSLKNHVHLHTPNLSIEESDKWLENLIEKLLNKPYAPKRSPWELHLIQNFPSLDFAQESNAEEFSVLILQIHHAMVDMYSIFNLFVESLCGNPIEKLKMTKPSPKPSSGFMDTLKYPFRLLYFLGRFYLGHRNPFLVPNEKRLWYQVVSRGCLVPVSKIKFIKSRFGVTFADVLNSAISAALSRFCTENKKLSLHSANSLKNMMFLNIGYRPNHPKTLKNHADFVDIEIPLTCNLDSLERLKRCEKSGSEERNSPMPQLTELGATLLASHPVKLTKLINIDKMNGGLLTNFAGSGVQFSWNGANKAIGMDFAVGALVGDKGIIFSALSHVDKIRICVTAELAICSNVEVRKILDYVYDELESLHTLAHKSSKNQTDK